MSTGFPIIHGIEWTTEKVEELRVYYPLHSTEQTAAHFCASVKAIEAVLRRHGIRKQQRNLYMSDRPMPRIKAKSGSGVIAGPVYRRGYVYGAGW